MSHSTSGAKMSACMRTNRCVHVCECANVCPHEKNCETHSNCRTESWSLFAHTIVKRENFYPHRAMAVRLIRKIVRILFSKPVRAIFPFLFCIDFVIGKCTISGRNYDVTRQKKSNRSFFILSVRFSSLSRFWFLLGEKKLFAFDLTHYGSTQCVHFFFRFCACERLKWRISIHECVSSFKGYRKTSFVRSYTCTGGFGREAHDNATSFILWFVVWNSVCYVTSQSLIE